MKNRGSDSPLDLCVIRAFWASWGGVRSIVFEETAGKARYATYLTAKDAGYEPNLIDVKVTRAKAYDVQRTVRGTIPTVGFCHDYNDLKSG